MGEIIYLFERRRFRVRVLYREPTYERATGRERTYSGTFEVSAHDVRQAGDLAVRQFKEIERKSGVGWAREIVDLQVMPISASTKT